MPSPIAAGTRRGFGGRFSAIATLGGSAILSLLVHAGGWPHYAARAGVQTGWPVLTDAPR